MCSSPTQRSAQLPGVALERLFRKPSERRCKSRIFAVFRDVACVFLKYWVSERAATFR